MPPLAAGGRCDPGVGAAGGAGRGRRDWVEGPAAAGAAGSATGNPQEPRALPGARAAGGTALGGAEALGPPEPAGARPRRRPSPPPCRRPRSLRRGRPARERKVPGDLAGSLGPPLTPGWATEVWEDAVGGRGRCSLGTPGSPTARGGDPDTASGPLVCGLQKRPARGVTPRGASFFSGPQLPPWNMELRAREVENFLLGLVPCSPARLQFEGRAVGAGVRVPRGLRRGGGSVPGLRPPPSDPVPPRPGRPHWGAGAGGEGPILLRSPIGEASASGISRGPGSRRAVWLGSRHQLTRAYLGHLSVLLPVDLGTGGEVQHYL